LVVRVLRPLARIRRHPAQPLVPGLAAAVRGADVVHTHQVRSAPSRHAAWAMGRAGAVGDASGTPVVASRPGGVPEVVVDGGTGSW
jgi:hypothetical protein